MASIHSNECPAVAERKRLVVKLTAILDPYGFEVNPEVTDETIEKLMSELQGIVTEYADLGDQMLEACYCDVKDRVREGLL